ncbi:SH3 domain-containing protein [Flagellimonas okinawensis]|uniref:SH3 domain-containing protein n=1 Tax=Flagellimonas okinawensis TaxID=3031324 RepID=A0ABT5XQI0_9FLAO|nr:SH3 domain-containing protein [[Muricauda] okinawensis]MDF0708065.1 SH3 domain-containing protein [[Muricauda] okinawensis]
MKNLLFTLICFSTVNLSAQGEFLPPKMEISDYSLSKFLTELTLAVGKQDKQFIVDHLDPHILNNFGGDGGIDEFKMQWNLEGDSTNLWEILENILLIGGPGHISSTYENSYTLPFTFSDWPEEYDAFEHYYVLGNNVNVRDKPTTENSEVIGQLSYQIVKISDIEENRISEETKWLHITTVDNSLSGFVYGKYLVSPIGYRMGLIKRNNGWMINMLVAGD